MAPSKVDKSKGSFRSEQTMEVTKEDEKLNSKIPAVSLGATKDSQGIKVSLVSPAKGRRSKADILKSRSFGPGWYIRSTLVQGGLELIAITTNSMLDDAYTHNLKEELEKGSEDGPFAELGLLGAFNMRISLANPNPLCNSKNKFQRKAFVRLLDEDETDDASRLAGLNVIRHFLQLSKNNRYETKVFIEPSGWDMTPKDKEAPKLDHFLLYSEIVKIIQMVHGSVNSTSENDDVAAIQCYFTEGHIPYRARKDFGFPENMVLPKTPQDDD